MFESLISLHETLLSKIEIFYQLRMKNRRARAVQNSIRSYQRTVRAWRGTQAQDNAWNTFSEEYSQWKDYVTSRYTQFNGTPEKFSNAKYKSQAAFQNALKASGRNERALNPVTAIINEMFSTYNELADLASQYRQEYEKMKNADLELQLFNLDAEAENFTFEKWLDTQRDKYTDLINERAAEIWDEGDLDDVEASRKAEKDIYLKTRIKAIDTSDLETLNNLIRKHRNTKRSLMKLRDELSYVDDVNYSQINVSIAEDNIFKIDNFIDAPFISKRH